MEDVDGSFHDKNRRVAENIEERRVLRVNLSSESDPGLQKELVNVSNVTSTGSTYMVDPNRSV